MNQPKRIILGIDPGSRCTGYGIIWSTGSNQGLITHGFIPCNQPNLNQRLYHIYHKLCEIIHQYQPQESAIEQVFTCNNPQAALKLGQARGAALTATAKYALIVSEYSARHIKKSVSGFGAADKTQIQHMVRAMLGLTESLQADSADALAIALCHAFHLASQTRIYAGKHA